MKCPQCVRDGQRSTVDIGMTVTTAMVVYRYYDEDGNLVVDDPNTSTTMYVCSRGHEWAESERKLTVSASASAYTPADEGQNDAP